MRNYDRFNSFNSHCERGRQLRRPRIHHCQLLLGGLENIDRDQDHVIFADVAVIVRRAAGRSRGIARMQYLLAAVSEPNLVRSLHEIDDGRPVFVAMDSDVAAWLDSEYAHPKLPAGHAFDLVCQFDYRGFAGRESLIAFRGILGTDGVSPPHHEDRGGEQCTGNLAFIHNWLPLL